MFRSTRDRASSFLPDLLLDRIIPLTHMHILRLRRLSHDSRQLRSTDQLPLPPVPLRQDLRRRGTPQDPGMDQTREAHPGQMAGAAEDALEVPDRLGGLWVDVVEKPATVFFGEDAGEAPGLVLKGLDVLDLDEQDVAWFGVFDLKGSAEVVDFSQVDVADVVGAVVVADLAAGPVDAFDLRMGVIRVGAKKVMLSGGKLEVFFVLFLIALRIVRGGRPLLTLTVSPFLILL